MQVMFFASDGFLQPILDRRLVQFHNPAPPRVFIFEHFNQAVLANMPGAGQIPKPDYDETEDAQSMSTFESGDAKKWLETLLADRLVPDEMEVERYTKSPVLG
jgi:hypothetical protein